MNDQKNLLLAIVASLLILLVFQYFFPSDNKIANIQDSQESNFSEETIKENYVLKTRDEILKEENRILLSTSSRLKGSISLKGSRIDDVILRDYKQNILTDSPLVTLMSPKNTAKPYFAEFGWAAPQSNIDVPRNEAVWKLIEGKELSPSKPIKLQWISPDNLTFTRKISIDENFLFTIEDVVTNKTTETQTLQQYARIRRTGTPETSGFYILHEGPIGVLKQTLLELDYDDLLEKTETKQSTGGWIGITDKYWLAALIPNQKSEITGTFKSIIKNNKKMYEVNYTSSLFEIPPNKEIKIVSNLFIGAKEVSLLDSYSKKLSIEMFDRAVDFGWFYVITKPLFQLLHWFSSIFGNVGLSILALTIVIRIILFPLANKSFKSMSKMKVLTPKIQEIRNRYKNDKLKMQQEIMQVYKNEKVNPLSGCLPILIQIPIFFALYKVLFVTLETRHAPFYGWIKDLSAPDPTTIFNLFGLLNFTPPSFLLIGIWPILMAVTMFLQTKLNPAPPDPLQAKIMTYLPVVFLFLFATFPAGLVIYWTWNNVLSIGQQWIIMKRTR